MINACDDFAVSDREQEHDLRVEAAMRGERSCVVSYLRRTANDYRKMASRALADTRQNKLVADRWNSAARHIDELARAIEVGGHWR